VEQGRERGRHLQVGRRPARALRRAGLDGSQPTIAYCRIGERSSHTWVVLRELLGHSDVKNYDGSWTEYGSLIGVPIELGTGAR
jgi:thiosulfate/3-mercaptopyruvate sulfurtransferase